MPGASAGDTAPPPALFESDVQPLFKAKCLRCHGDPAHAPAAMRALYPGNGGFNWRLGETVGAQIVSVPFEVQTRRSRTS